MAEIAETHEFDRRSSDVNVQALATRMRSLEDTVHSRALPELEANTRVTNEVHGAIFGVNGDDGLQMKVQEIYDVFETARNGFRVIAAVGNGCVRVGAAFARGVEKAGKVAQPILWLVLLGATLYGIVANGSVPEWVTKLAKVFA